MSFQKLKSIYAASRAVKPQLKFQDPVPTSKSFCFQYQAKFLTYYCLSVILLLRVKE